MRYIIGIDLGTTNSCVAYVDTQNPKLAIQQLRIPQLVAAGYIESLPTLPSFCYLPALGEWPEGSLNMPWGGLQDYFVGGFAQTQGAKVPTRLVHSAKSWLCCSSANRRDKFLPFEAADAAQRISPVEASSRYLRHIKDTWNHVIAQEDPEQEFEQQEIILTVPASFDEVARLLTIESARLAGFVNMTLLEEPQAAFYSWLSQHEDNWKDQLFQGACTLICDVGGGTTDFSLIEVTGTSEKPALQRIAVGEHLLLGGDNMDTALAHLIEPKLFASEASPLQWMQLKHQARNCKEALLAQTNSKDIYRIMLQGSGSSIVKESISQEIPKTEVQEFLLNGFFGQYSWEDSLKLRKTSGMRSMGLPYEDEPSITKHLACFLNQRLKHKDTSPKQPDFVLFNGGVMKPLVFQNAILNSLASWFPEKKPKLLSSFSLDLAVSRGAAYYGKVRRGLGVRVGGGSARGFYMSLDIKQPNGDVSHKAMSLLPRGVEEGASYEPDHSFLLRPNTPVSFQLYSSHVRLDDKPGELIDINVEELQSLPPIHTVIRYGKKQQGDLETVPVNLKIALTPIGTLELWLQSLNTDHRWNLEFQLKDASGQENAISTLSKTRSDETVDKTFLDKARQAVLDAFNGTGTIKPEKLMDHLEQLLEKPKKDWKPSILRGLWDPLLQLSSRRKASSEYDARWWNFAGFFLRPGFGYPLDDHRIKELWKVILADLNASKQQDALIQTWICYRRIAGGLNKGQQMQIASDLMSAILSKRGKIEIKAKSALYPYTEQSRALASLELIELPLKLKFGDALIAKIENGGGTQSDYWSLARLGSRELLYGSLANVIPRDICNRWVQSLLAISSQADLPPYVLGNLARKTSHREINLPQTVIDRILERYSNTEHDTQIRKLLLEESHLTVDEKDQLFGEKLPSGLTLHQHLMQK